MNKFTFHVVSLPHTQTTKAYSHCAYTQKVRKFCNMMSDLGHEVYLYASEENEARVKELVTVVTKARQRELFGEYDEMHFPLLNWQASDPAWSDMNSRAVEEIKKRIQPRDFICLIGGDCQKPIMEALPEHMSVEYGIGYVGTFAPYRVFESYAHMHYVYGTARDDNGHFFDTVIPNYYDTEEFPLRDKRPDDPYFLFMGRLIDRKGYHIAQQVCEQLGKRLVLAGQAGPEGFSGYGEYVGAVGVERRGELMSQAEAVFMPTTYLEPFGGVHAEAMLCGTPVITTNFGVFTETVVTGVNGYRCDMYRDFLAAVGKVEKFSQNKRIKIRESAQKKFSVEIVAKQYQGYFERLSTLWERGWYEI